MTPTNLLLYDTLLLAPAWRRPLCGRLARGFGACRQGRILEVGAKMLCLLELADCICLNGINVYSTKSEFVSSLKTQTRIMNVFVNVK